VTTPSLRRRRGGPILTVGVDLVRDVVRRRSWGVFLVVAMTLTAVVVGAFSHAAVPFLVYGGL